MENLALRIPSKQLQRSIYQRRIRDDNHTLSILQQSTDSRMEEWITAIKSEIEFSSSELEKLK